MKDRVVTTGAALAMGMTVAAHAATMEFPINATWFTAGSSTTTFSFPAVASIDAIALELAHVAIVDLTEVELTGPGTFYQLLDGNTSASGDLADLGDQAGDFSLGNVAAYVFRASGDPTSSLSQSDLLGGYNGIEANQWTAGGAKAGNYQFTVRDQSLFNGGGSVGKLIIEFTPADGGSGDGACCFDDDTCRIVENAQACTCPGDVNPNGSVGFADLQSLLQAWGNCPGIGPCRADLDNNGSIGFADLQKLLQGWGDCAANDGAFQGDGTTCADDC